MEDNNRNEQVVERAGRSTALLIIGWIFAIGALFRYPFVFGALGIVFGIIASKNGSRSGVGLIIASFILMAIGLLFGGVINSYTMRTFGL